MLAKKTETDLEEAILLLETKKLEDEQMLKDQFHIVYDSLKPLNIIHKAISQIAESKQLKTDLLNLSVGLTVGYLSEKLLVRGSHSPIKKLLGSAVMVGVTNVIAQNPDVTRMAGLSILRFLRKKISGKP